MLKKKTYTICAIGILLVSFLITFLLLFLTEKKQDANDNYDFSNSTESGQIDDIEQADDTTQVEETTMPGEEDTELMTSSYKVIDGITEDQQIRFQPFFDYVYTTYGCCYSIVYQHYYETGEIDFVFTGEGTPYATGYYNPEKDLYSALLFNDDNEIAYEWVEDKEIN